MRVQEVARQLGVSADWLRRLERLGRIPTAQRDMNGTRRYSENDVMLLRSLIYSGSNKALARNHRRIAVAMTP